MVQFDPEHLRIAAKLREHAAEVAQARSGEGKAFVFGLLICAALQSCKHIKPSNMPLMS
jgi:hypothetical protein